MIVILNGAFGAGKTTVARLLARELPNSLIFDPELVGFVLRSIPRLSPRPEDFQDYKLWCPLVVATARLLQTTTRRTLILPICLWNPVRFQTIVTGLRAFEPNVRHFCLTASVDTIHARLLNRGRPEGCWEWVRAERCCEALSAPLYAQHIATDTATPRDIASSILLALAPPVASPQPVSSML